MQEISVKNMFVGVKINHNNGIETQTKRSVIARTMMKICVLVLRRRLTITRRVTAFRGMPKKARREKKIRDKITVGNILLSFSSILNIK